MNIKATHLFISCILFSVPAFNSGCSFEQSSPSKETVLPSIAGGGEARVTLVMGAEEDGQALVASTIKSFKMRVDCDGGITKDVDGSSFTLPIRAKNCLAKLRELTRLDNRRYLPKSDYQTFQQGEIGVFEATDRSLLNIVIVKQLPATLSSFSEVRYQFTETAQGQTITRRKNYINFTRVVIGDEAPSFELKAVLEPDNDSLTLEMIGECKELMLGASFADAKCGGQDLRNLKHAIAPYPADGIVNRARLQALQYFLIGASARALLISPQMAAPEVPELQLKNGGYFAPVFVTAEMLAIDLIYALNISGTDSYTYYRVTYNSPEEPSCGGVPCVSSAALLDFGLEVNSFPDSTNQNELVTSGMTKADGSMGDWSEKLLSGSFGDRPYNSLQVRVYSADLGNQFEVEFKSERKVAPLSGVASYFGESGPSGLGIFGSWSTGVLITEIDNSQYSALFVRVKSNSQSLFSCSIRMQSTRTPSCPSGAAGTSPIGAGIDYQVVRLPLVAVMGGPYYCNSLTMDLKCTRR